MKIFVSHVCQTVVCFREMDSQAEKRKRKYKSGSAKRKEKKRKIQIATQNTASIASFFKKSENVENSGD